MANVAFALHVLAFLLAALLAWRAGSSRQRSIMYALAILIALDLIRRGCANDDIAARIAAWHAGTPPPPYVGWQRLAWATGQAVSRAWYFVITWGVWRALRAHDDPPRRWLRVLFFASVPAMTLIYFIAYTSLRGEPQNVIAVVGYVLALVGQLAVGTGASLRGHWPTRADRASWLTAYVLICSTLAGLAGPWALARPRVDWFIVPWIAVPTWLIISGVTLWSLLFHRRTESPSA